VTEEAQMKGFYEACNSVFDYTGGAILLDKTIQMLKEP
jgi:hypothetical protein